MEKEIEIIKSLINDLKREEKLIGYDAEVEIQAIENLIKGYRELTTTNLSLIRNSISKDLVNELYISKSEIRKKIRELEGMIDGVDDTEYSISRFINQRDILQELMEDK